MRGEGCEKCNNTGYYGRLAVVEVLTMNQELQALVIQKKSSDVIHEAAVRNGMQTLFQNALEYFRNGQTTLEEVLRVSTVD